MANPPKLSKAEKTANYEALKLKEKLWHLAKKKTLATNPRLK